MVVITGEDSIAADSDSAAYLTSRPNHGGSIKLLGHWSWPEGNGPSVKVSAVLLLSCMEGVVCKRCWQGPEAGLLACEPWSLIWHHAEWLLGPSSIISSWYDATFV